MSGRKLFLVISGILLPLSGMGQVPSRPSAREFAPAIQSDSRIHVGLGMDDDIAPMTGDLHLHKNL